MLMERLRRVGPTSSSWKMTDGVSVEFGGFRDGYIDG